ncbi:MAG: hypothetical protein ACP5OU_05825 [Methanothrix sp.]
MTIMSGAAQSLSFQELIDAVESMPLDDQSMLIELINKRIQEKRRAELVAEVREARDAFIKGDVKRGTFEDLMKDLKD